jgi:hypothetical protein
METEGLVPMIKSALNNLGGIQSVSVISLD